MFVPYPVLALSTLTPPPRAGVPAAVWWLLGWNVFVLAVLSYRFFRLARPLAPDSPPAPTDQSEAPIGF